MNHCGVMMVKKAEKRTEESRSDDVIGTGLKPAVKNDHDLINDTEESSSEPSSLNVKEVAHENRNETFPRPSSNHEEPEVSKPETASPSSTLDRFAFEEPKIFKPISGMDIEKEDLDAVILRPRGRKNSYPLDIPETSDDKEIEDEFGILLPRSDKFANPNLSAHDPTEEWVPGVVEYGTIDPIMSPSEDGIEPTSVNPDANASDVKDESFYMDENAEKQSNEIHDEQLAEETDEALVEQSVDTKSERVSAESIGFIQKIKNLFSRENEVIEAYDPEIHGMLSYFDGIENYEEVNRYWVNEPYVFTSMSDFETVFLAEVQDRLRNKLLVEKIDEDDDKEEIIEREIRDIIKDYTIGITPAMLEKIFYYTRRDFINFGMIDPLMNDDSLEDISGNGHDKPIFLYHKNYQNIATNIVFDEEELNSFIIQLAQRSGKHISVADPMVDATMPDGSRIQMTLGKSVTTHGSTFTIRKFNEVPITPVDLLKWGTFSTESMAYLWLCIENNKSLIYAGGTASGKTSSLNAVSLFIPEKAKIISLEDTRELKLPHPNWIPGVTRDSFTSDERGAVDMYDLLKAALRQRPEYLLVGEVRGKEALTLFQAMSTGHTTFSTMHADSVPSAIHRLENPPISVPRNMIQALDIMCIQAQTYSKGKRVRRNLKLVEIVDIDPNTHNIRTNDVFVWDSNTDSFHRTGESKALMDIRIHRGWNATDVNKELKNRQRILEYMMDKDINNFKQISNIINTYQSNPGKIMKELDLL